MFAVVGGHAGLAGELGEFLAIVRGCRFLLRWHISAVKGVGQLVIVAFPYPADGDRELFPETQFGLRLGMVDIVEQLVVAIFVGGDAAGNLRQQRLFARIADGRVIGGVPDFPPRSARSSRPGANRAPRPPPPVEMIRPVAFAEAGKGLLQLETGIGHFGPAAQGAAVLGLLAAPLFDGGDGLRDRRWRRYASNN